MHLRTKLALAGCALAPFLTYGLKNLQIIFVRTLNFVLQIKPPESPQFRNPSFDFYLFRFLAVACPVVVALIYYFGIRAMHQILRGHGQFLYFNVFFLLYVLGAFYYFLPAMQPYTPLLIQLISLSFGVICFAALARLRDMQQKDAEQDAPPNP